MMKNEFKNTTTFNRAIHDSEHTYTLISNVLLKDQRLNFFEIGLMTWILSNSDDYVLNLKYAETISGFGKTINNNASQRLQEFGYLRKERGKGGWDWTINEIPYLQGILQGSNTNFQIQTLGNEGSDVNANKSTLINDPIINNNEISNNEINTKEETSIEEINNYPNSTNLNNNNCQSKEEVSDTQLNVVGDDVSGLNPSSSTHTTVEEKIVSGYDSFNIQDEIGNYNPIYFKDSNEFVGNNFNEFVKETNNNIPILKFEKVLLLEIHNQYVMTNPSDDEYSVEKLKQYLLKHNPTITPSNIQNMLTVMKNPKNTETITNIIEKYNPNK